MNLQRDYLRESEEILKQAKRVICEAGIREAWEGIGARVNLVGSVKMDLMANHRDIDFHIYTDPFVMADSFIAIARLAENPRIHIVTYTNLVEAEDRCIEWHAHYRGEAEDEWRIDMIHILPDSPYAGYFEHVAERIMAVLTPETREAILRIKFSLPDDAKVPGIRIYRAVIEGGVRKLYDFQKWDVAHPINGIEKWIP